MYELHLNAVVYPPTLTESFGLVDSLANLDNFFKFANISIKKERTGNFCGSSNSYNILHF